eukprot:COSAG04_NODE_182_length_21198_cov_62.855586_2_plen_124_part_00
MSVEESLLMIRQKIINKCGAQADNMHRAFRVFDKDGSGEIGVEEFQEVMQKEMMLIFDDKLANEIIDTLDTDHSVREQPSDPFASRLSPPFMPVVLSVWLAAGIDRLQGVLQIHHGVHGQECR